MAKHTATKNGFGPLRSDTDQMIAEHLKASKELAKKLKSKKAALDFLIRAGIAEKNGKRLAAPYR